MLKTIDNLKPFFEDCYRRISVREYARLMKMSPPTASKTLEKFKKEDLLVKENDRIYNFYSANKDSKFFIHLSQLYWYKELSPLIEELNKKLFSSSVILFGSLSKAEVTPTSDIDLAIFSIKKEIDFTKWEKKLKRKIQIFYFKSLKDIKNKELANNILNGFLLRGRLK